MKDRLTVVAAVFCVIFIGLCILFLNYCKIQNELESQKYIKEIAENSKTTVNKQIEGDFQTLDGVAKMIGGLEEVNYDTILPVLKTINDDNAFIRMGFVDKNGITMGVDIDGTQYKDIDISDKEFVEKVYAGERVITNTQKAEIGDLYVNFYAVPIIRGGRVISALCAVCAAESLHNILNNSVYAGNGFAHIVDSQGNYVIRSKRPTVDQNSPDIITPYNYDDSSKEKLKSDLRNGQAGNIEYYYNGEKRWAAYTPIGVNDWFVFCVVPSADISRYYSNMIIGIVGIILGSALLFLFLLIRIRRMGERSRRELEKLAFVDSLTGYRNEQKFMIDAEEAIRKNSEENYAILYADIKNFKYVNEIFGYDVGDKLLKYWADGINKTIRDGEVFARFNVDNLVSIRKYKVKDELKVFFETAKKRLCTYPDIQKYKFKIEMYMGIYLINQNDNISLRDMLNRANVAVKAIKNSGESRMVYYNDKMREEHLREIEMESRMETALDNGEFKMYLQPKIDCRTYKVAGAEALVRWKDPNKGIIPPSEFISLFERNGFIVSIDRFMLEEACRFYKRCLESGDVPGPISVNVSRKGLWQPDFVEFYTGTKERYNIPDGGIELEFTESFVFEDYKLFISSVSQLHKAGFSCSLDDFGAGQSSLNVLKNIPIDTLKLDMLFFRESNNSLRDKKLWKSIIEMAKALDMKTVSEGVENTEQVEYLKEIGCDLIQGFVFSKPLPAEEFISFIKNWRNDGDKQ